MTTHFNYLDQNLSPFSHFSRKIRDVKCIENNQVQHSKRLQRESNCLHNVCNANNKHKKNSNYVDGEDLDEIIERIRKKGLIKEIEKNKSRSLKDLSNKEIVKNNNEKDNEIQPKDKNMNIENNGIKELDDKKAMKKKKFRNENLALSNELHAPEHEINQIYKIATSSNNIEMVTPNLKISLSEITKLLNELSTSHTLPKLEDEHTKTISFHNKFDKNENKIDWQNINAFSYLNESGRNRYNDSPHYEGSLCGKEDILNGDRRGRTNHAQNIYENNLKNKCISSKLCVSDNKSNAMRPLLKSSRHKSTNKPQKSQNVSMYNSSTEIQNNTLKTNNNKMKTASQNSDSITNSPKNNRNLRITTTKLKSKRKRNKKVQRLNENEADSNLYGNQISTSVNTIKSLNNETIREIVIEIPIRSENMKNDRILLDLTQMKDMKFPKLKSSAFVDLEDRKQNISQNTNQTQTITLDDGVRVSALEDLEHRIESSVVKYLDQFKNEIVMKLTNIIENKKYVDEMKKGNNQKNEIIYSITKSKNKKATSPSAMIPFETEESTLFLVNNEINNIGGKESIEVFLDKIKKKHETNWKPAKRNGNNTEQIYGTNTKRKRKRNEMLTNTLHKDINKNYTKSQTFEEQPSFYPNSVELSPGNILNHSTVPTGQKNVKNSNDFTDSSLNNEAKESALETTNESLHEVNENSLKTLDDHDIINKNFGLIPINLKNESEIAEVIALYEIDLKHPRQIFIGPKNFFKALRAINMTDIKENVGIMEN